MEIGPTAMALLASVNYTFSLFALLVMHIAFGDFLFADDSQPSPDVLFTLRIIAPFQTVYIIFNILAYRYIIRPSADKANSPDAEHELSRMAEYFQIGFYLQVFEYPWALIHCFRSSYVFLALSPLAIAADIFAYRYLPLVLGHSGTMWSTLPLYRRDMNLSPDAPVGGKWADTKYKESDLDSGGV